MWAVDLAETPALGKLSLATWDISCGVELRGHEPGKDLHGRIQFKHTVEIVQLQHLFNQLVCDVQDQSPLQSVFSTGFKALRSSTSRL